MDVVDLKGLLQKRLESFMALTAEDNFLLDYALDKVKTTVRNIANIKDKEERKYWRELRRINQIPQIFIPTKEVFDNLKGRLKETSQLGGK